MRAAFLLLVSFAAMAMTAVPLSKVRGQVTNVDSPLPGCTVRLESATQTRITVADEHGNYDFAGVPASEYEVFFELAGFESKQQRVVVRDGDVTVPTEELSFTTTTETITLACGRPCMDEVPTNRFDLPRCTEYELHNVLIEAAERGDASSVSLLQSRYATADTYLERHRLGGALLRKIQDDSAIWNDLARDAEIVLRFPNSDEPSEEFLQYCAERNLDPERFWGVSYGALQTIREDSRSHALLLRALETDEDQLLWTAIEGLAAQHDLASLPLIEKAIVRNIDDEQLLWSSLAYFTDERADAIALKHLQGESAVNDYRRHREEILRSKKE